MRGGETEMNMKQVSMTILGIVMLTVAVLNYLDAPTKRNLKTVVVRSLPFI